MTPPLALLVPAPADLLVLLSTLMAIAAFIGLGRLLAGGATKPEIAVFAGWGAACLVLTVWGTVTMASLRIPGMALLVLGLGAWGWPGLRPDRAELATIGRVLVLSVPIWLVMVSVRPSLPDSFTNFLPNALYLHDYGMLPADDRAPALAVWPALPYSMTFAGFLAALPFPWFPPATLVFFNIVTQLAFGLFLARVLVSRGVGLGEDGVAQPGWVACALGLLLTTGLNPGFQPQYEFSSYGEGSTAATLALAGWLGLRLLAPPKPGWWRRSWSPDARAFGLVLAALVTIRESNIALFGAVFIALGLVALFASNKPGRRFAIVRAAILLTLAAIPAVVTLVAWRLYVRGHFVSGELLLLPIAQWRPSNLVPALINILKTMGEKATFFAVWAVALGLLARRLLTAGAPEAATRMLGYFVGVWVVYVGFLLTMYVVHFEGEIGASAHSFFRYNTHLALILMLALAMVGRDAWQRRPMLSPPWTRWVGIVAVLLMLVLPIAALKLMRFDLVMPYPVIWDLAEQVRQRLGDGDRLTLVTPPDTSGAPLTLRAFLTQVPTLGSTARITLDAENAPARPDPVRTDPTPAGYVLESCAEREGGTNGTGKAVLYRREDGTLRSVMEWSYPPARPKVRWLPSLTGPTLCH
ncbi:MAG TPA: hypothetical protein VNT30_05615 [Stellaceae bacterium]|nr:hypothetical protein [Stellaceae bacterium]